MNDLRPGDDLKSLAERFVRFGLACGADEVEVGVGDDIEFGVDVRMGEIENLVEAGSRSMGIRVIKDQKTAFAGSSDLAPDTIERLIRNAVRRAELANRDEFAGFRNRSPPASIPRVSTSSIPRSPPSIRKPKIALAMETERIALSDRRITNSHGASYDTHEGYAVLANSERISRRIPENLCRLERQPAGRRNRRPGRGFLVLLQDPPGRTRLAGGNRPDGRRPDGPAAEAPQNQDPARSGDLRADDDRRACSGSSSAASPGRRSTRNRRSWPSAWASGSGRDTITVIDDGLLPRLLGSSPFDSEGVPSRRTVVVENGVLKTFLCNTYAGRKIGLPRPETPTAAASARAIFTSKPGTSTPGGDHPFDAERPSISSGPWATASIRSPGTFPGRLRALDRKRRDRLSGLRDHDLRKPGRPPA